MVGGQGLALVGVLTVLPTPMLAVNILFAVALDFFLLRLPEYDWRPSRPRLAEWHAQMVARSSFQATAP